MIRLTKQTDYGIVLLCEIVAGEGELLNAPELAARTQLPAPMVSKTLKLLGRAGLLESHRGVKGGYTLARPAEEVTVVDIIEALDGPIAITECAEDTEDECSYEAICRVRSNWLRINRAVSDALSKITLAEMAEPWTRRRSAPGMVSAEANLVHLGTTS